MWCAHAILLQVLSLTACWCTGEREVKRILCPEGRKCNCQRGLWLRPAPAAAVAWGSMGHPPFPSSPTPCPLPLACLPLFCLPALITCPRVPRLPHGRRGAARQPVRPARPERCRPLPWHRPRDLARPQGAVARQAAVGGAAAAGRGGGGGGQQQQPGGGPAGAAAGAAWR